MTGTLRAALVGLGVMGRNHARILQDLDGVELVAVVDPVAVPDRRFPPHLLVGTVREALERGIDYAVVAAPTELHVDIGLELAAHGVPFLIEKPVASSVEEATTLLGAVAAAGVIAGVGHIERFNPAIVEMRRRILGGEIGELYQIATRRQGPFPDRIRDAGVILDLASHDLDLAPWLAVSGYARIHAEILNKAGRAHEDMVSITARLESGVIVSHLVNWLTPFKERTVVVTGSRGAFIADTLGADLTLVENPMHGTDWEAFAAFRGVVEGNRTAFAIERREPLRLEHEDFRDAVLSGSPPAVTLPEGLAVVEIAERILHTASGQ